MERHIDQQIIAFFSQELVELERSSLTIEKYIRDVTTFRRWLGPDGHVDKNSLIRYKQMLREQYRLTSANSMLQP